MCSRIEVSTSNSGRSSGVAKPTPPVATQRHAKRLGEADQRVVVVFLIALQVPLQLDVGIAAAEHADDAIEQAADAEALGAQQRAAGHGDEAGGEAVELVDRQRALAFRRAQLHPRQQAAEIAPAFLRGAQAREVKTWRCRPWLACWPVGLSGLLRSSAPRR